MVKRPRLSGKQLYHHIYAWGNDRHPVFKVESHYEKYLAYLEQYGSRYAVDIIAYALMTWHVHLFVYDKQGKISQFMNSLHGEYAQYYNHVTNRVGHVFGERFNNKIVQADNYGLWLSRYIHRQPLEAGIVNDPKEYRWSSYRTYLGLAARGFLKPEVILEQFGRGSMAYHDYEEFTLDRESGPIDWNKVSNLVVGDDNFAKDLRKLEENEEADSFDSEKLIKILSVRLEGKPKSLLNPRGQKERRIRHEAFRILVTEYGFSAARVSRVFGVSAMAVAKVAWK